MKLPSGNKLNELSSAIGAWAAANFDIHAPDLGVVEEIGEATHCILKRVQGIRGFDNPEHFKVELTDALADAAVYTLHAGFLEDYEFYDVETGFGPGDNATDNLSEVKDVIGVLMHQAGDQLMGMGDLDEIMSSLALLAQMHDIDFLQTLESTWEKVSKRNWRKNPTNADKVLTGDAPAAE